jgi:transcription initiation factor IIE alpha subunit
MARQRVTPGFVMERFKANGNEKLVLLALLHRREQNAREEYTKIPAEQLAELTGLSVRTVRRTISKLADRRIIQVHTDKGRNGNRYKIHAEDAWLKPKQKPRRKAEASDTNKG